MEEGRKEATHNGNKVWLFNREVLRKIILSGLRSCLPIQILIFPHTELGVPVILVVLSSWLSKFHNVGPEVRFSKVPKTFRARKAICKIANRLFWKADLLTFFPGNKKKSNCQV